MVVLRDRLFGLGGVCFDRGRNRCHVGWKRDAAGPRCGNFGGRRCVRPERPRSRRRKATSRQRNVRFIIPQTSTMRAPSPCCAAAPKARMKEKGASPASRRRNLGIFRLDHFRLASWDSSLAGSCPGEGPGGILGDIVIGIIGAIIGGWIYGCSDMPASAVSTCRAWSAR